MSTLQSKPEAAVFYASLGWSLLPLHNVKEGKCSCGNPNCPSPGKHPRVVHGVKDASKDPEQVNEWWARWPEANIGVAAGKASGFFILDIDGPKGIELLKTKSADLINSTLPVVKTGSGTGRHLYFKPFLDKTPNGVRVAPDIDIKGDDGYGILPPSDHISGGFYEWKTSPEDAIPEAPRWLKQLITRDKQATSTAIISEAIPQGQRNDTLMSIAGTMRRRNLEYDEILVTLRSVNQNRCFPPLDDSELSQIAKSVSRYNPEKQRAELNELIEEHKPRIFLDHITQIENPVFLKKRIEVQAIVSSTSYPYAVPKEVKANWVDEEGGRHSASRKISITSATNMMIVGTSTSGKRTVLQGLFPEANKPRITDLEYRTVYTLRVRPPVFSLEEKDSKLVDEKGFEYKSYKIYVVSDSHITFPASSLMRLRGVPLPDPKSQSITFLVSEVEFPDKVMNYDMEKIKELEAFFDGLSVENRVDWVLDNFEEYSRIVGRRNIAVAAFIGVFSPIQMNINGEIQRGWCNILILGDTTTAKTKTIREMLKLVQTGTLITAETASTVGLTGAAVQIGKEGWSVDWGFLVLNDMGILAVDGAHKLKKSDWAALAESERKGIVTIAKAAKDTAYARTRQIKIANPVDPESIRRETKNLNEFYYPVTAAGTFLDLMSVARLDLCVFADSFDVKAEEINKKFSGLYDERLHYLAEVRKWVWSVNPEIVFETEAEELLLECATELHTKFFYNKIPLASIDLKWKLGILSASLGALTLSTNDYKSIIIKREHINWIKKFIETEYMKVGLHTLVESTKYEEATQEIAEEIVIDMSRILGYESSGTAQGILKWIATNGRYVKEDLKAKFSLSDNSQLRPLNAYLSNKGLVKRGNGFYATPTLNRICKILITIIPFIIPENDIPPEEKVEEPTENKKGIDSYGNQGVKSEGGIVSDHDTQDEQDKLGKVLAAFHYADEDLLDEKTILTTVGRYNGIGAKEGRRLIGVLERNGTIHRSEEGFYKITGGSD